MAKTDGSAMRQYWPIIAAAAVVIAGYGANMRELAQLRQSLTEEVALTREDRAELNDCKLAIGTVSTDIGWVKKAIENQGGVLEEIRRKVYE